MANPQKENGYTTIANELLEAIYCGKFSPTEFKMLLFILRYTYGFNRKVARLSNSFISGGTKIHEVAVSRAITSLIKDNVLIEQEKPCFNQPRLIGVNKNYESWQNRLELTELLRVNKNDLGVNKTVKEGLTELFTKKENIINKTIRKENISCSSADEADVLFEKLWKEYPNKKGKVQVKLSHKKALIKIGYEKLSKAIKKYDDGVKDKQYLMYGGRFFTTGYLDYIDEESEVKENERNSGTGYFENY